MINLALRQLQGTAANCWAVGAARYMMHIVEIFRFRGGKQIRNQQMECIMLISTAHAN